MRLIVYSVILLFIMSGCERSDNHTIDAGKTPEGTLRAYYYYKDRGDMVNLRKFLTNESLSNFPEKNHRGMSQRAQERRGIVVDHSRINSNEASFYYRTWFSLATKNQGGRIGVASINKEDGVWKFDTNASIALRSKVSKGMNRSGFYDGTKEWWK